MSKPVTHPTPLTCAYLVNQYPKVSHSFIRREILALERQGVLVHRFALRGWDEKPVDPMDAQELLQTQYVLKRGVWPLLVAGLIHLAVAPRLWWRALAQAFQMSMGSDRSLPYHLAYFLEACWLSLALRKAGVQHVHAHFGTNSAETAVLAAMLAACRCSFTVHGPEEFDRPQALHLRTKAALSSFVVAISSYGRSQLFRWLDTADWHKVKVVHCGLDGSFMALDVPVVPSAPRLVCVGRLCEQKGQLLLMAAAAELKRQHIPFQLVLAGDGEMRPQVEALIAQHGLQAEVSITGWISGDRVRQELLEARAMILPSFAEGLPVVIMEAMAMQRPVLSTYVAGIPELVRDGETGWLFPAGDVEAMVAAMKHCLACSPQTLHAMGEAGRRRVMQRHDIDAISKQLVSAISDKGATA